MVDGFNLYRQFGKEPSWSLTLGIHVILCLGLYAAFNIGKPQEAATRRRESTDLYFLSVRGGSRPHELQSRLLHQFRACPFPEGTHLILGSSIFYNGNKDCILLHFVFSLAKSFAKCNIYSAWYFNCDFVASIWYCYHCKRRRWRRLRRPTKQSLCWLLVNLGRMIHFGIMYVTKSSKARTIMFQKKIKISHQQVLEIIGLNTRPLQDFLYEEQKSKLFREEIGWLKQTLVLSDSNWRIIVGFDPLIICSENKVNKTKGIKFYEPFRHIFLRYGVNAYLSTQGCAGYFYHDGPTMYIGNPGPADETQVVLSASKSLNFTSELQNGFLLHRVTPLEIESYMIDSEGRVAFRSTLHHHGRGAI